MGSQPNNHIPFPDRPPGTGWLLLFHETLPAPPGSTDLLMESLASDLGQLGITPRQVERIAASIQAAVSQACLSARDQTGWLRLQLQVFAPLEAQIEAGANSNWGFFWIKKTGEGPAGDGSMEGSIEVYLYRDG